MYKRPEEQGGHAFLPLAWFRPPIHVRACQINAWPILRGCLLARRMAGRTDGIGFEQALEALFGLPTRFSPRRCAQSVQCSGTFDEFDYLRIAQNLHGIRKKPVKREKYAFL